MKTRFSVVCLAVLCCFVATAAFAQPGAEKAAAASSVVNTFSPASAATVPITTPFVTVVSTNIKPPGGKDLFINFSAVTAVFALSVNNDFPFLPFSSTFENVGIQCRCRVDGTAVPLAPPSPLTIITLDNLVRQTNRSTPFPPNFDFLTLVTQEGGARSYIWTARDVGVGNHTVDVQCRFQLQNARFPFGTTFSLVQALIGPKQLQVEEVDLKD